MYLDRRPRWWNTETTERRRASYWRSDCAVKKIGPATRARHLEESKARNKQTNTRIVAEKAVRDFAAAIYNHSFSIYFYAFLCISMHLTVFLCIFNVFLCTFNVFQCISMYFYVILCIVNVFLCFLCISMYF